MHPSYSRIIDRIHHHPTLCLFLVLFLISWLGSLFFPGVIAAVEQFGSHLAKRKGLCILLLALTPIVLRLSLLWAMPIPFPKIHDEFSYLLAADTFSHGRLTNPPHPMQLYFDTFHVNQQPTYMSIYPPAQGAFLALGQLLGHPWIGVLLSVSVMSGAILWALQGWLPPRWALLGGVLASLHLGISTYWINSYWGGAVAAIGGALVFGALPRIIRSGRVRDALALGLGTSILANSRPFEGLVFCLPVFIVLIPWLCSKRSPSWRTSIPRIILPFGSVMLLCICFMAYYNFRLTGHPALSPYVLNVRSHFAIPQLAWAKSAVPFHFQNPQFEAYYNQWWAVHAWKEGRPNSVMFLLRALKLDASQFVLFFVYPGLLIAALALPQILRDRRMRLPVAQVICCFAGFLLVAMFMPHYAAPLTATIFTLTVQGLRHLRQWRFREYLPGVSLSRAAVISTLLISPTPFVTLSSSVLKYRQQVAAQLGAIPGNDLIIVHYSLSHDPNVEWVYNAADVDHAKIVWAREIPGVPLQPLLTYFHDRHVWLLNADDSQPTLTPCAQPVSQPFVTAQLCPVRR